MLLLALAACTSEAPAPPARVGGLAESWIAAVVAEPARFTQTVDAGGREGWVALHANDWPTAAATDGAAAQRADASLAELHTILARLHARAWLDLGRTWEGRGSVPADSAFPLFVSAAAREAGDAVTADRWLTVARASTRAEVAALAGDWADPLASAAAGELPERARAHARARRDPAALPALLPLLAAPAWREPAGAQGERAFWDPFVHRTLAAAHRARAEARPDPEGLAAELFLPRLGPPGGALDTDLTALGLALPVGADDPEACREVVRGLDALLDPWAAQLAHGAPPDGQALLADLRLVPATRARVLVGLGQEALVSGRPRCALAYADLALDHESPRAIGPTNPPTLFALLAAANLETGRTRESLDALEVLSGTFPEVAGLDETVGDLSVLVGLTRSGDSREH